MQRALFILALLGLVGLFSGCTKDEKAGPDGGADASVQEDVDSGDGSNDVEKHKKCTDVGPLHRCVGLDDCPWYDLRTQFTCPVLFVCCVDWTPPSSDSGVDSGG